MLRTLISFGQAATQAPQPMQAAASFASSANFFAIGTACAWPFTTQPQTPQIPSRR
jgi:hypothetical protein